VVDEGLAVTVAPDEEDKLAAGAQEYVVPPFAVNTTLPPGHVEGAEGVTETAKFGATFTTISSVPVHPFALVTVTIYVAVDAGVAKGFEIFALLNPVAGDHAYIVPPEACNCALPPPKQSVVSEPALAITGNKTVTTTVSASVQPEAFVTVTI
jgi:hypothetical protein